MFVTHTSLEVQVCGLKREVDRLRQEADSVRREADGALKARDQVEILKRQRPIQIAM